MKKLIDNTTGVAAYAINTEEHLFFDDKTHTVTASDDFLKFIKIHFNDISFSVLYQYTEETLDSLFNQKEVSPQINKRKYFTWTTKVRNIYDNTHCGFGTWIFSDKIEEKDFGSSAKWLSKIEGDLYPKFYTDDDINNNYMDITQPLNELDCEAINGGTPGYIYYVLENLVIHKKVIVDPKEISIVSEEYCRKISSTCSDRLNWYLGKTTIYFNNTEAFLKWLFKIIFKENCILGIYSMRIENSEKILIEFVKL